MHVHSTPTGVRHVSLPKLALIMGAGVGAMAALPFILMALWSITQVIRDPRGGAEDALILSFVVLPLVVGMFWRGQFRWLAVAGTGQAVVLGLVWASAQGFGDAPTRLDAVASYFQYFIGGLLPIWLLAAYATHALRRLKHGDIANPSYEAGACSGAGSSARRLKPRGNRCP
jgi:hypothetical protein